MEQQSKLEGSTKPRRVKHSFTQSINGTPGQVWEEQMNYYLETGELIPTPDSQAG